VADSYKIGQGDRAADGTTALLRLGGELDINARDDVRDAILSALDAGAADILVDLSGVSFIDSESLSALIEGYNACRSRDVAFRVANAHGLVDRVLTVSGAMELFGA